MGIFNDKRVFSIAVKAIQDSKAKVPFNKTWKLLNQELGIGDILNNNLLLTANDRKALNKIIQTDTGIDALSIDLSVFKSQTRNQVSSLTTEEKWSGRKIKEDIIYVRSLNNCIKLEKDYLIPCNSYLAITWQKACKHRHQSFVIIENLETFLVIEQINWPEKLKNVDPLFIYRGDIEATPAGIKKIIQESEQEFYAYFDYDPAGLMMALTMPKLPKLIIPNISIDQLKIHTKKSAFNKQSSARVFLKKIDPSHKYYEQATNIVDNKIAVMQETIFSRNIPLKLIEY